MSRQLEAAEEDRRKRRFINVGLALDSGLEAAVSRAGGQLLGFSVKCSGVDYLMTLRIEMPGGRFVAFVSSDTLGGLVLKAQREAASDGLRLKEDRFTQKGD